MKKILFGLTFLMASSAVVFADTTTSTTMTTGTSMDSKWICTTNASSSDVAADKAADDQMAKVQGSAVKSFEFASQHCRDCTKITCEVQD